MRDNSKQASSVLSLIQRYARDETQLYETLKGLWDIIPNLAEEITSDEITGLIQESKSFTPTLVGSGGGTPTYSAQNGYYTKIGELVCIHGFVSISAVGTIAGNLSIGSLPFNNRLGLNGEVPTQILWHGLASNWITIIGQILQGSDKIDLFGTTAATASSFSNLVGAAVLAAGSTFKFRTTYRSQQ